MENLSPWIIFFASIFTGNILLVYFLGMCSFLSVSSQVKTSLGLGMAVTFVLTITSALNYLAYFLYSRAFRSRLSSLYRVYRDYRGGSAALGDVYRTLFRNLILEPWHLFTAHYGELRGTWRVAFYGDSEV